MSVQLEGLAGRTADSFVHRRIYGRSRVACAPVGRQSAPNGAVSSGLERQRRTAPRRRETRCWSGFRLDSAEAGDGARTHDPQLGKLMLYQLSYARVVGAV
jgi:hypothetical protein